MRGETKRDKAAFKNWQQFIDREAKREYVRVGGNPRSVRYKRMVQAIRRRGL